MYITMYKSNFFESICYLIYNIQDVNIYMFRETSLIEAKANINMSILLYIFMTYKQLKFALM